MKKIKLGHIGTAHDHSQGKLDCVKKYPDIFEVVGIVEDNNEYRSAAKKNPTYHGYKWMSEEELFNTGIDAVLVEGYELDLVNIAKRCIDCGVHIHVDKPAGDDINSFENLLKTAKAKNLIVQLAYMYRYNPAVLDCIELVKEGKLGELYEVDAIMNTHHALDKRKWLGNFNGGNMFFLGCHMADLVFMLLGTPEKIISYNKSTGIDGINVIDHGFAVWEYKNGISTIRATSTEINGYARRQLVVCGSEGTYTIMPLENPIKAIYSDRSFIVNAGSYSNDYNAVERNIPNLPSNCRYDAMILDFAAMVRGEKENQFTYEYELQLQKLVLASCGMKINYREEIIL